MSLYVGVCVLYIMLKVKSKSALGHLSAECRHISSNLFLPHRHHHCRQMQLLEMTGSGSESCI